MQIALYKGKSLISRIIRWVTRSEYSHAAFLFDESAERRAFELTEQGADLKRLHFWERGSVVEAWQGGVKNSPSVATLHTPGTPVDVFRFTRELNEVEERSLIQLLSEDVGRPYDYRDLLCFLTRRHGRPGNRVFCSLLVAKRCCDVGAPLFRNTEAWRVPPDWIGRTVALYRSNTFITQRAWKGNSYIESSRLRTAVAGLLMMAALLLGGCATVPQGAIENFDKVEAGIYRGGQPEIAQFAYLKTTCGVSNVVKLNLKSEGVDDPSLSSSTYYFPINSLRQMVGPIYEDEIRMAVSRIKPGTYVHCEHGQDRTGLVIACYRVWVEGWTKADAEKEMLAHGFHRELRALWEFWEDVAASGPLPPKGGVPIVGPLPPEGGVPVPAAEAKRGIVLTNWMPTVWPTSPAEVWLTGNGTNVLGTKLVKGTGTASNPFGGDFDWIKANLPERCRVHLYAGNYWSAADWDSPLKSGQYWSGAGMEITTIHRDRRFSLPRDQSLLWSYAGDITIEDLTLDANGDPSDQWQRNGMDLFGGGTVYRVHVIHSSGCWSNGMECFPIFAGGPWTDSTTYSLVSECRVSEPMGDYISAITLNGRGEVSRNFVSFPPTPGHFQCYLAAYSQGALFEGNVSEGGNVGFYTDTGSERDLAIVNNSFFGCLSGVILWKAPGWDIDGLTVSGNHIWLGTNDYTAVNEWTSVGIGVWVRTNQVLRGVVIEGNDVRSASAATTAAVRIIGGTNAPVMRDNTLGGGMIESWTQ